LALAAIGDEAEETPKSFEAAATRYELRKVEPTKDNGLTRDELRNVRPQKKHSEPPKPETDNFRYGVRPK
jgi:hypothetical protein